MTRSALLNLSPRAGGYALDLLMLLALAGALGALLWLHRTQLPAAPAFGPEWPGAILLAWGAQWLLQRPAIARRIGDGVAREDGVWITSRAGRVGALLRLSVLVDLSAWAAAPLPPVLLRRGGYPALGLLAVCCALVAVVFAWAAWRSLRGEVELRIDRYGVYRRGWGAVAPWSAIKSVILVGVENNHAGDGGRVRALRLRVGPNQLPGITETIRRDGGVLDLDLGAVALSAGEALRAIQRHRPQLDPASGPSGAGGPG